jgi:predicted MPP superfamily phosphohydrolase
MWWMKAASDSATETSLWNRRNAINLLLAGGLGSVVNGFCLEPSRCSLTHTEIYCPDLPGALDGLRVGVMADFHFKPGIDEPLVQEAVDRLQREKPDLIALPGDFIDSDPAVLDPLLRVLRQLAPEHGVFASMGNHDGWNARREVVGRSFERVGIPLLINRNSVIRIRGEKFAIAATDHVWRGKPDPARALRGIPSGVPVLALVHEPDFSMKCPSTGICSRFPATHMAGSAACLFWDTLPPRSAMAGNTSKAPSPLGNPGFS